MFLKKSINLLSIFFILSISSLQAQTTRYVSTASELTTAISASSTSVIDVIEISNDIVVTSQVTISKSLTINGNGNKITVSINGVTDAGVNNTGTGGTSTASNYRVFTISGTNTVTINNLTIKGGNNTSGGGCIYNSANKLILNNVVISNGRNSSTGGGGLYNASGGVTYMTDCNLTRNSANYGGGFINQGTMYINRCTFSENRSESASGGGGACENQSILYINNSTFANNKSTEIGGAINNYTGTVYVMNSTFSGNVAYGGTYSGGAIGNNSGSATAVNCLFAYNYYLTGGSVSNPTAFTLNDFGFGNTNAYYCIHHTSSNLIGTSLSNVLYSGSADGSNNTIFAGGIYTKITNGAGTEIGTAKVYQPYLVTSTTSKTATLKIGSFPNQTANKGCVTGYTDGNGTPSFGYKNMSTSAWVNLVGSNASSNTVTKDQLNTTRGSSPTRGSVEVEISTVYMLKVLSSVDGTSTGGSLYGDVYESGTQVTLTASPNAGKQFSYWQNSATSASVSTSNPYTVTISSDLTLVPIFVTATSTYSVTYVGNNNTSGTAPSVQTFTSGSITISTKNTLAREEYFFDGWNTQPNGTGTNYAPGASYSTTANLTLYAKWTPYIKYYPKSANASSLYLTSSWSGTPDGTGGSPSNFGSDKEFILSNSAGTTSFATGGSVTFSGPLTIGSGKTLTISTSTSLTLSAALNTTGTISGAAGSTLILNSTEAQSIGGTNNLMSLTINNSAGVTLTGSTNIFGTLLLSSGVLTTGGNLTIKSNSSNTGIIGEVAAGSISGNVTVERYIPARRAYRLISSPVNTSGSIYTNWQESGSSTSGLGTHITGSTTGANGFDATQTGNASLYTHNNSTQSWSAISNTNTNTLTAGNAYRLMVRGDRTVDISINTPTPTNTTLRSTGTIVTGNQTVSNLSTAANGFSFIGNPYQAPVNMQTVLSNATNLNTSYYYIWDPTISTRGAYVTVDVVNNTNALGSAANRFLQPGQACFVKTVTASSASLTFTEASKASTLTNVFGQERTNGAVKIRLHQSDSLKNGAPLADGLLIQFNQLSTNDLDQLDAIKPINQDENLSTLCQGKNLSIETRQYPIAIDSIQLNISQYRSNQYHLEFEFDADLGIETYLVDHYLKQTFPITSSGTVYHQFETNNSESQSLAKDRFVLVFKNIFSSATNLTTQSEIKISPNPSTGIVNIEFPNAGNTASTILIENSLGQVIYRQSNIAWNYSKQLDFSNLSNGIYTLKVDNGSKVMVQKIQIAR